MVPNNKKKDMNSTIKCFRLLASEDSQGDADGVVVQSQPVGDEDKDDGLGVPFPCYDCG